MPLLPRSPPAIAADAHAAQRYPDELVRRVVLGDEALTIRPIRPDDADAHRALFARLTPEDVRFRFFHALRELRDAQIDRLTRIDYVREMAFVATHDGTPDTTVGVARLVRDPDAPATAEFAILVDPAHKGRGLARLLMQCLFDWGRGHGVRCVTGQILADNQPMLAFARRLGFTLHRMPGEEDVMEARRDLGHSAAGQ